MPRCLGKKSPTLCEIMAILVHEWIFNCLKYETIVHNDWIKVRCEKYQLYFVPNQDCSKLRGILTV